MPSAENRFVEIGRIGRPHGLEGIVRFIPNEYFNADLFERISVFYMRNQRSDIIPVRIEQVQTEQKRNQQTFFVKFDLIASRDDAEQAVDRAVFIQREHLPDPENSSADREKDLTGYSVYQQGIEIGNVLEVFENPAHPILQVKYQSSHLLIPFVDEYVERVDHASASVYCRNLHQLTES
jgi:16S rRNA processing protein RimM